MATAAKLHLHGPLPWHRNEREACLPPAGMLSSLGIQFCLVLRAAELGLGRPRVSLQTFNSQDFRYPKLCKAS